MNLKERARRLEELHHGPELLVLPNVWDPFGARLLEARGFPAVATASASIAESLAYADGERLQRATMLAEAGRIAAAVEVPVTADLERGYGDTPADVADTVRLAMEHGIVATA